MRADSRSVVIAVLLLLLTLTLGAGGYWLYQNLERYEDKSAQQFSANALRDPYLAADYLLRELGTVPNRDGLIKQLDHLPAQGVIVITAPSNLLSDKQAATLRRWLSAGGHLIVIAGSDEDIKNDPLLGPFGISREEEFLPLRGDEKEDDGEKAETRSSQKHDAEPGSERKLSDQLRKLNRDIESGKMKELIEGTEREDITDVVLEDNGAPLRIAFSPHAYLHHAAFDSDDESVSDETAPFYWAGTNGRVHFAQFEVDAGLLTVASDLDAWTSKEIGKHDHALALMQLVDTQNGVSLIADTDMPPLTSILWQWAAEFWIGLLLLAVMWVWRRSRRFGPTADPQLQIRRSLAEHILASATYLWRGGKGDELFAAARQTVMHRAQQLFAEFATLDTEQQTALLHSHTGIDAAAIQRALFGGKEDGLRSRDAQLFRENVSVLQQLNQRLAP